MAVQLAEEASRDVARNPAGQGVQQHAGSVHSAMLMHVKQIQPSHENKTKEESEELRPAAKYSAQYALVRRQSEHIRVDDLPAVVVVRTIVDLLVFCVVSRHIALEHTHQDDGHKSHEQDDKEGRVEHRQPVNLHVFAEEAALLLQLLAIGIGIVGLHPFDAVGEVHRHLVRRLRDVVQPKWLVQRRVDACVDDFVAIILDAKVVVRPQEQVMAVVGQEVFLHATEEAAHTKLVHDELEVVEVLHCRSHLLKLFLCKRHCAEGCRIYILPKINLVERLGETIANQNFAKAKLPELDLFRSTDGQRVVGIRLLWIEVWTDLVHIHRHKFTILVGSGSD